MVLSKDIAEKALAMLAVDELGLENADRKILETIIKSLMVGGWHASSSRFSGEENLPF